MADHSVTAPIIIESLTLELAKNGELRFSGTISSTTAQAELSQKLEEFHAAIVEKQLASFTADVRALEFVNSSAIRLFVAWISRAERARYKLVFTTDPAITWQRLSFSVLKALAPASVEIVEKAQDQPAKQGRARA